MLVCKELNMFIFNLNVSDLFIVLFIIGLMLIKIELKKLLIVF